MDVAKYLRPAINQVKISTYSDLPFGDESFDRIISLETLEHAAEPQLFLRELHRVAKNGARMVLSCPPATSELPYRVFTFLFGGHGEGPHRFPPSRRVKKWLKRKRLETVGAQRYRPLYQSARPGCRTWVKRYWRRRKKHGFQNSEYDNFMSVRKHNRELAEHHALRTMQPLRFLCWIIRR